MPSHDAYDISFRKFLSCTDEKAVLLERIASKVKERDAQSMLDIGAGNGDLAIPLSKLVQRYIAVEANSRYVGKLRAAGLHVLQDTFPCAVPDGFDFCLASHSLPWNEQGYKPFIRHAAKSLALGGTFLAVTYDDERGAWKDMLGACGLTSEIAYEGRLHALQHWLRQFVELHTTRVTTHVRSLDLQDMLGALSFVHSGGTQHGTEEFLANAHVPRYLQQHHRTSKGYSFPFEHVFLEFGKHR